MTPEVRQAALKARYDTLKEVIAFCKMEMDGYKDLETDEIINVPRFFQSEEIKKYCEKLITEMPAL